MSEPFLGEIRVFGFSFAPNGWAFAQGQLIQISQNTALFALYGTAYGGDGRTTFGLPDLRGRAPMHFGQGPGLTNRRQGERSGQPTVTLALNEMPEHSHALQYNSGLGTHASPQNAVLAGDGSGQSAIYGTAGTATLNAGAVQNGGGGSSHNNMPPYLVMNFCVALTGLFPS